MEWAGQTRSLLELGASQMGDGPPFWLSRQSKEALAIGQGRSLKATMPLSSTERRSAKLGPHAYESRGLGDRCDRVSQTSPFGTNKKS